MVRRVAGVDTLILRDAERGSFAVARDWTDLATPDHTVDLDDSVGRLDVYLLCDLVSLIELLANRSRGGLAK
jgi:hypothetical protein